MNELIVSKTIDDVFYKEQKMIEHFLLQNHESLSDGDEVKIEKTIYVVLSIHTRSTEGRDTKVVALMRN
jgi:hypothetical protein